MTSEAPLGDLPQLNALTATGGTEGENPEPLRGQNYRATGPGRAEFMRITEALREEHRVIERGLAVLEGVTDRIEEGRRVATSQLKRTLAFLQGFAEGCHHRKEEEVLFPFLKGRGLPPDQGPIEILLEEHDVARSFMRAMREAVASAHPEAFVAPARDYVAFLRDHIAKEDQVLLSMAEERLAREDDASLHEAFQAIEAEQEGGHEAYLALLADLERVL